MRNRPHVRVRSEAHHAELAGVNVNMVRLGEYGIGKRSRDAPAAQNEKPGLSFRLETPCPVRREIDPLQGLAGELQLKTGAPGLRGVCRAARTRFPRPQGRSDLFYSKALGRQRPKAFAEPVYAQVRSP